jgi:hypothetical protein
MDRARGITPDVNATMHREDLCRREPWHLAFPRQDLSAPISAVVPAVRISRGSPTSPIECRTGPIAGMPGIARSDRIPIAAHPAIARAGHGRRVSREWRGRRSHHCHRSRGVSKSNSRVEPGLSEEATSDHQCQDHQFAFHFFSSFPPLSPVACLRDCKLTSKGKLHKTNR